MKNTYGFTWWYLWFIYIYIVPRTYVYVFFGDKRVCNLRWHLHKHGCGSWIYCSFRSCWIHKVIRFTSHWAEGNHTSKRLLSWTRCCRIQIHKLCLRWKPCAAALQWNEFSTYQSNQKYKMDTLQEINISHLGKRKIIFKIPFLGDMLVPWRVTKLHHPVDESRKFGACQTKAVYRHCPPIFGVNVHPGCQLQMNPCNTLHQANWKSTSKPKLLGNSGTPRFHTLQANITLSTVASKAGIELPNLAGQLDTTG